MLPNQHACMYNKLYSFFLETFTRRLEPIQPQEYYWDQTLMFGEEAWVQPKGVQWGWV